MRIFQKKTQSAATVAFQMLPELARDLWAPWLYIENDALIDPQQTGNLLRLCRDLYQAQMKGRQ